eukprot:TRINITY_DN904_c0_g2_i1.p1 TRINITY_DN904_c0_g2~~TRINITY_DN904_c0_g2_i1.p1  ORF type:complete len:711 (-),score=115.11 TRINITY_DN904_c0_g2_i1:115-2247(-)
MGETFPGCGVSFKGERVWEDLDEPYPIRTDVEQAKSRFRPRVKKRLSMSRWRKSFDREGRLVDVEGLLSHVQRGGIEPRIRGEVWEFLLGVFASGSTMAERRVSREKRRETYEHFFAECQEIEPTVGCGEVIIVPRAREDGSPLNGSTVMTPFASGRDHLINGSVEHASTRKAFVARLQSVISMSSNALTPEGFELSLPPTPDDLASSPPTSPSANSSVDHDYERFHAEGGPQGGGSTAASASTSFGVLGGRDKDTARRRESGAEADTSDRSRHEREGRGSGLDQILSEDEGANRHTGRQGRTNGSGLSREGSGASEAEAGAQVRRGERGRGEGGRGSGLSREGSGAAEAEAGALKRRGEGGRGSEIAREGSGALSVPATAPAALPSVAVPPNGGGAAAPAELESPTKRDARILRWRWTLHQIGVDVLRTDRCLEYFESKEHQARLMNILAVYAWLDDEVGYCQGMSDMVAPLVVIFPVDADAFWCFERLMRRMRSDFKGDRLNIGVQRQLDALREILTTVDPLLLQHLDDVGAGSLFFAVRTLMAQFRRELTFADACYMWEMMWAMEFDELELSLDAKWEPRPGQARVRPPAPNNGRPYPPLSGPVIHRGVFRRDTVRHLAAGGRRPLEEERMATFCVAAVLEAHRGRLLAAADALDEVMKVFNDGMKSLDPKRTCKEAVQLHRKHLSKVGKAVAHPPVPRSLSSTRGR